MKLALVTLFPEMTQALTGYGVTQRAFDSGLVELRCWNPRDFTTDKHQTVDDRPYGGGPGMVMKPEPLELSIKAAKEWVGAKAKVIYLSPQGALLKQSAVENLAAEAGADGLVLLAGRYEGVDERLLDRCVDEQYSIGDYVISGGELAAMVLMDAVIRLIPGALGHNQSAEEDSFSGHLQGLLDCPHYTRPEWYEGQGVPEVLLSGNHQRIERWRLMQSLGRTAERRPDLMAQRDLTKEEQALLVEYHKQDY